MGVALRARRVAHRRKKAVACCAGLAVIHRGFAGAAALSAAQARVGQLQDADVGRAGRHAARGVQKPGEAAGAVGGAGARRARRDARRARPCRRVGVKAGPAGLNAGLA